jgi:sulfonate transport system permease protein
MRTGNRPVRRWRRLATPALLLVLWAISAQAGWIDARTLAPPTTVLATAADLVRHGELQRHLLVSLRRVVEGATLGITTGLVLALIAGLSRRGEDVVDAPLQMLRTLPVLALVPLFILWFGIGEAPKVLLVALGTMFPVYVNTFAGIRSADVRLVEAARTLGLGRGGVIANVILPSALPAFLVGVRYALGIAWLVLVVSEQINATSGIGFLMTQAREFLRTDVIVVGLFVYGLLGLGADLAVRSVERTALAWRPTLLSN